MTEAIAKLLQKLPAKTVAIILSASFFALCAVLITVSAIAINTHRSVALWPPKIGSDPQLASEVAALKAEVTRLVQQEQALRGTVITSALVARQKAVEEMKQGHTQVAKLMLDIAQASDQQIKDSDNRVSEQINALELRMRTLQDRL